MDSTHIPNQLDSCGLDLLKCGAPRAAINTAAAVELFLEVDINMLTLYGAPMSRAHRVMWMLKELRLDFVQVPTDFHDGSTHTPEFLAINPNGRVPALVDDGLYLCESLAINLYLAKKHKGPLTPADLEEEALVTQWSFWVATEVEHALLLAAANLLLFAEPLRSAEEAQMAITKLQRPFKVLEAHLERRSYLVGERFTVADLNVSAVMTLIPLAGIVISDYRHMSRWLTSCLERPAAADWKPIMFLIPRPPTPLGVLQMFL